MFTRQQEHRCQHLKQPIVGELKPCAMRWDESDVWLTQASASPWTGMVKGAVRHPADNALSETRSLLSTITSIERNTFDCPICKLPRAPNAGIHLTNRM